jgi:hypothetical protein
MCEKIYSISLTKVDIGKINPFEFQKKHSTHVEKGKKLKLTTVIQLIGRHHHLKQQKCILMLLP